MIQLNENKDYLHYILKTTFEHNHDNIARTKAYQNFYIQFPEIKWTFLASMVSRNAGWNMTDLDLPPFQKLLRLKERNRLFMTYERANWLIFSDTYPQLLVYKLFIISNKPLFFLLRDLKVTEFMIQEWNYFWTHRDKDRLMTALIINEQNVIHDPVIKQRFFKHHVFLEIPYLLQDFLFMNAIVLPTRSTEIYGLSVHDFTNLSNRITLGKQIASILYNPIYYNNLLDFALNVEHTGSRKDYERFLDISLPVSPILRLIYPVITHQDNIRKDWYKERSLKSKWLEDASTNASNDIGASFYKKRNMLYAYYHFKNMFKQR